MLLSREKLNELNYICRSSSVSKYIKKEKKKLLDVFKYLYLFVILATIIVSFIPTFVDVRQQRDVLQSIWMLILNIIVFVILLTDYVLRWITYPVRIKHKSKHSILFFPFTSTSLAMLLSLLPTLLGIVAIFIDNNDFLKAVNVLSITKILRLLMLLTIVPSLGSFIKISSKERTLIFTIFFIVVAMIFIFALVIYSAEGDAPDTKIHSYWDALYFTFITITTIGYGEMFPVTALGKTMVVIIATIGIIIIAIPTAIITGTFVYDFHNKYHKNNGKGVNRRKPPLAERIYAKINPKHTIIDETTNIEIKSLQIILTNVKDKNYNSTLYKKIIETLGGSDNILGSEYTKDETFIIDIKNNQEIKEEFYTLIKLFDIGVKMDVQTEIKPN